MANGQPLDLGQISNQLQAAERQAEIAKLLQRQESQYLGQLLHSTAQQIYARLVAQRYTAAISDELLQEFAANSERAAITLMRQFYPGFTIARRG